MSIVLVLCILFCLDHQGTVPGWDEENSFHQKGDSCCFFKEGTMCDTVVKSVWVKLTHCRGF